MGHDGMLYSLPSREIIADSVEYMVNAHCADAIVCISNCDKITPGMLMAALRLNIPVVFVSGGPMEAGKTKLANHGLDLVDAMVVAADDSCSDEKVAEYERSACPTCGSCSGMFTANSMNCLTEALGLSCRATAPRWPPTPTASSCSCAPGVSPSSCASVTTRTATSPYCRATWPAARPSRTP